jgi:hypothetical protein
VLTAWHDSAHLLEAIDVTNGQLAQVWRWRHGQRMAGLTERRRQVSAERDLLKRRGEAAEQQAADRQRERDEV